MSHLIPEQRTDKNGVTSTKWVRPEGAKKRPSRLPSPTALPAAKQRAADVLVIRDAMVKAGIDERSFKRTLENAESLELLIIADAITNNDEIFNSAITTTIASGSMARSFNLAVVYDPELHKEMSRIPRFQQIQKVTEYAIEYILDAAGDLSEDPIWSLALHEAPARLRAKRIVAAQCAMESVDPSAVEHQIIEQIMDDSRSDHDEMISLVRENPTISCSQLNFLLEGGHSAISRGAL